MEDEQLDFGEGEDEELVDNDEDEHLLDEDDEAGYDEGPNAEDNHEEAEEDVPAGLGDEDMQDVQEQQDAHVANGHEKQGQQQQSGQQEQGGQQDGQGGKKSGPRKIELDKPSGKFDHILAPRSSQQKQPQQPQQQQQQQLPRSPAQKGQPSMRPPPRNTLRTPLRYFMLRSVNMDNWQLAQREGCWATQPQNEVIFNQAFKQQQEVVLFMSVQQSGAIQGYGRIMSLSGRAPQVQWLDINADAVNNFYVSWDCTVPLPLDSVKHLTNPWSDVKLGARSKGPPLPLNRHRDGQELAPQIGEALLRAMNAKAAAAGKPATGPLAQRFVPGAGGPAGPAGAQGWQQRPGMPLQQQQMQMQQQQQHQRMMMMQQQQQRGVGGRGMIGGRGMMGAGPGAMGPGRGVQGHMMQQQPQPPPPGRPHSAGPGGMRPGAPASQGPMINDPRLNPRFAGRLQMDRVDDFHAGGRGQRSPPAHARSGERDMRDDWEQDRARRYDDSRDRRYDREYDREHDRDDGRKHGHRSRSRRHSRSRSRSPPRAASSRGGSTGRAAGGAAVGESSWGSPDRQRQQEDGPESIQDMSYEEYLATWEKVQQRIKQTVKVSVSQAQPEQQLALALPGPPQQQVPGAGSSMMGPRGLAAGAGGGMMGSNAAGVGVGGRMMAGGGGVGPGGPDRMMRQGMGAAAAAAGVDGGVGPGRPADVPGIPTFAEYMQRIKHLAATRGQPCPPEDVLMRKYQEKVRASQQAQQQQQQQPQRRMPPQPPAPMGMGMPAAQGMGMGMNPAAAGMNAMNPMMAMNAMNPMGMMAATAMAAAAMGMGAGMMGGAPGAMMSGGGGMVGGGMHMQQQGMGQGGQMGRGGGRQGPAGRGGRGQMPMQQMGGGGF